ncbi:MAG TPA: F0F1 ATP synthase subunit A [Fibrobacteraceae bacterium]|nr:F0F1 ATP synthase subunit A [Fibrobacteraceae bacterium]
MSVPTQSIGDFLLEHVANGFHWKSPFWSFDLSPLHFQIAGITFNITLDFLMIGLAVILCLVILIPASRRHNLMPTSRFAHAIEATVLFLRDDVVVQFMGEKLAVRWTPFALTLFFFILALNLIGLIPFLHSASGNISVTGTMAILIFILFNVMGMWHNGVMRYLKAIAPGGLPLPMMLMMYPMELVSMVSKSMTLAIRLFANMAAGHFIVFSLLGLMALMHSYAWGLFSVPLAVAMYGFDIFVAFLQAYIFTLLSMLFIGSAIHQEH